MNGFVDIYIDDEDIIKISSRLGRLAHKTPVVITRAANKGAAKARTDIEKETTNRYLIQKGRIRSISRFVKASYSKPVARLTYVDSFLNLTKWRGTSGGNALKPMVPHQGSSRNPKNYFAHVKRSNPFKALAGGKAIPFVQVAGNGHKLLFRRLGRSRYPVQGVAAPAIPQVVKNGLIILS